jgi:hypothetical protein
MRLPILSLKFEYVNVSQGQAEENSVKHLYDIQVK